MKKTVLWTGLILGCVELAVAQEGKPAVAQAGRAFGEARPSAEEKTIRLADDAFVQEYNKADTKALLARFTEDA